MHFRVDRSTGRPILVDYSTGEDKLGHINVHENEHGPYLFEGYGNFCLRPNIVVNGETKVDGWILELAGKRFLVPELLEVCEADPNGSSGSKEDNETTSEGGSGAQCAQEPAEAGTAA